MVTKYTLCILISLSSFTQVSSYAASTSTGDTKLSLKNEAIKIAEEFCSKITNSNSQLDYKQAVTANLISEKLKQKFSKAIEIDTLFRKNHPCGPTYCDKPPYANSIQWTSVVEGSHSCVPQSVKKMTAKTAKIVLQHTYETYKWTDILILTNDKTWKIDDIEYTIKSKSSWVANGKLSDAYSNKELSKNMKYAQEISQERFQNLK